LKTLKNKERDIKHQRKEEVEEILLQLERLISPVEQDAVQGFVEPELPVILIMGCARSGSTFLMQALADSGAFCYPTNLMSRFYYAPYIGSLLQRLLIDYDYKGEILGAENKMTFQSELGKTAGANSPHEFWYFWRRFFQFGSLQRLSDQDLEGVETHLFLKELASIQAVFQQPLLMKGMILNWNIPFLARIMKTAHFVFIETRDSIQCTIVTIRASTVFRGQEQVVFFSSAGVRRDSVLDSRRTGGPTSSCHETGLLKKV
jgi:hypothetical protein